MRRPYFLCGRPGGHNEAKKRIYIHLCGYGQANTISALCRQRTHPRPHFSCRTGREDCRPAHVCKRKGHPNHRPEKRKMPPVPGRKRAGKRGRICTGRQGKLSAKVKNKGRKTGGFCVFCTVFSCGKKKNVGGIGTGMPAVRGLSAPCCLRKGKEAERHLGCLFASVCIAAGSYLRQHRLPNLGGLSFKGNVCGALCPRGRHRRLGRL